MRRESVGKNCWYCGDILSKETLSIDHCIPRAKGGTDDESNLVPCCMACNMSKNNQSLEEFRTYRRRQRFEVPYFTRKQLAFFSQHNVVIPEGEPFYFWFELNRLNFPDIGRGEAA